MSPMRWLGAATVTLVAGIFIGMGLAEPREPSPEFRRAFRNLTRLYEVDIDEYFQLRERADRYGKAEEILGKVILLFLRDLHLRVTPERAEQARRLAESAPGRRWDVPRSREPASPPPSSTPAPEKRESLREEITRSFPEVALSRADRPESVAPLLMKARFDERKPLPWPLPTQGVDKVPWPPGTYQGIIAGMIEGETGWRLRLDSFSNRDEIRMYRGEEVVVSLSSRFTPFKKASGSAVLLSLPERWLAQLFYVPNLETIAGNFYRITATGDTEYLGTLWLPRGN